MNINKRKIGIIGAGHVGSHAGYALLSQGLVEEIVYIDVDEKKAEAQALDLYDSVTYLNRNAKVYAGNYSDIKDSQILIIAAGPLPDVSAGQTDRQQTLGSTVKILKEILPKIENSGFDGIILSVSNPADVVAHYIQNYLGWSSNRILSTSTTLDSSRLRRAISEATGYDQKVNKCLRFGRTRRKSVCSMEQCHNCRKAFFRLDQRTAKKILYSQFR